MRSSFLPGIIGAWGWRYGLGMTDLDWLEVTQPTLTEVKAVPASDVGTTPASTTSSCAACAVCRKKQIHKKKGEDE